MATSEQAATGYPEGNRPARTAAPSAAPSASNPVMGGQELPLVDIAVLKDLEEQLGRSDMARKFATDYSALWGRRERSLIDSVHAGDKAAALDAVISLKVSSAMVGGLRLARLAETLEGAVQEGDLSYGAAILATISVHGRATVEELQYGYLRQGEAHGSPSTGAGYADRSGIRGTASVERV